MSIALPIRTGTGSPPPEAWVPDIASQFRNDEPVWVIYNWTPNLAACQQPLSVTGYARDTSPRTRGEVEASALVRLTSPHLWGEVSAQPTERGLVCSRKSQRRHLALANPATLCNDPNRNRLA